MQKRSLEVMKTLICFTAVKHTGGVRDKQHFSALPVSLTYLGAGRGEVTRVLSEVRSYEWREGGRSKEVQIYDLSEIY